MGNGHPMVILYINFVELECPVLHAKLEGIDDRSGEEDFKGFIIYARYYYQQIDLAVVTENDRYCVSTTREKTCILGFWPHSTQIRLHSYRVTCVESDV